jgi:hypothetical protein
MALVGVAFTGLLVSSLFRPQLYGKPPVWIIIVAVVTGGLMTIALFVATGQWR